MLGGGLTLAANSGEKPDTPRLPWVVHDGTRPQPRKVETKGAVSVQAPADAQVLFDGSSIAAWTGAEWNRYDLVFKAPRYEGEHCVEPAKLTLFHNGVLLHNAKEYDGPTRHQELASYPPRHPGKGSISLEW